MLNCDLKNVLQIIRPYWGWYLDVLAVDNYLFFKQKLQLCLKIIAEVVEAEVLQSILTHLTSTGRYSVSAAAGGCAEISLSSAHG